MRRERARGVASFPPHAPVHGQSRHDVQDQRLPQAAQQLPRQQQRVGAVRRGAQRHAGPLERAHCRLQRRAGQQRGAQPVARGQEERQHGAGHVGEKHGQCYQRDSACADLEARLRDGVYGRQRVPRAGAQEGGAAVRRQHAEARGACGVRVAGGRRRRHRRVPQPRRGAAYAAAIAAPGWCGCGAAAAVCISRPYDRCCALTGALTAVVRSA